MSSEWDHIERIEKQLVKLTKRVDRIEKSLWEHELYSVHENLSLEDKIDSLVKVTRKNQDVLESMEWKWVDLIDNLADKKAKGGEK